MTVTDNSPSVRESRFDGSDTRPEISDTRPEISVDGSSYPGEITDVVKHFQPIIDKIADHALEREHSRELPFDSVKELLNAGFGALRVPTSHGGLGASIPQVADLLVALAAADSNLPQIFRGHLAFVEDRLASRPGSDRDLWFSRFVAGELVGNAWTEPGNPALNASQTLITPQGEDWTVSGTKYYTTGSIFGDWTDTGVRDSEGNKYIAAVSTHQPGVTISDDWDGFGQQVTGSGTIVYKDAQVLGSNVYPFSTRFRYQTAYYQLILISVLAGIAQAAEADVANHIRLRTRVFSHGNSSVVREDPQILAVAGKVSATAFAATAVVREVAQAAQKAADTASDRDSPADLAANIDAEIASAKGQVILSELVPQAATAIFDTLGASSTGKGKALDRHWRNARTVASHNPWLYKARIIGDWTVNSTQPPFIWSVGKVEESAVDNAEESTTDTPEK